MSKSAVILLSLLALLVLVNVPPLTFLLDHKDCRYANGDGSFTFDEMSFKERNFRVCAQKFEAYKNTHKQQDTVLYRLCPKNYWQFWNWGTYLFQDKFQLPYRAWEHIQSIRGPVTAKSGFQDF